MKCDFLKLNTPPTKDRYHVQMLINNEYVDWMPGFLAARVFDSWTNQYIYTGSRLPIPSAEVKWPDGTTEQDVFKLINPCGNKR